MSSPASTSCASPSRSGARGAPSHRSPLAESVGPAGLLRGGGGRGGRRRLLQRPGGLPVPGPRLRRRQLPGALALCLLSPPRAPFQDRPQRAEQQPAAAVDRGTGVPAADLRRWNLAGLYGPVLGRGAAADAPLLD